MIYCKHVSFIYLKTLIYQVTLSSDLWVAGSLLQPYNSLQV